MSKDDVEVPDTIPSKRRQLEDPGVVLDKWIAVWLARDDITPSERRRLEAEKQRRKRLAPEPVVVGLIAAQEGMTPPQLDGVLVELYTLKPTLIVHTRVAPRVHGLLTGLCRRIGAAHRLIADVRNEDDAARAVVHAASAVIAAPREQDVQTYATPGVWSMIGLARHRRLPVIVVLPSGATQQGGADG